MNNTERLLRDFIEASGFDVESTPKKVSCACINYTNSGCQRCNFQGYVTVFDYKVTKKPYDPAKFPFDTDG